MERKKIVLVLKVKVKVKVKRGENEKSPGENPEVEKYQDDERGETCPLKEDIIYTYM